MNRKSNLSTLTALLFLLGSLTVGDSLMAQASQNQKKVVVCSTTQIADFARQIVGDDWDVKCILAEGQDPHTHETTISDSTMVNSADLCLENGWHLEGHEWMQKLANNAGKPIITCVDGIASIQTDDDESGVRDPHAWFTPANAARYVDNITRAVSGIDPDNRARFEMRAALYKQQLRALDLWIKQQVVQIPANQRVLVTNHDAFGYFCQQYGFRSVSPGSWTTQEIGSVSTKRRQEVVNAIRETGVSAIFVETSVDQRMLREIARDAGVRIGGSLYSDAMGGPGTAGETYIGMMRENVIQIVSNLKD